MLPIRSLNRQRRFPFAHGLLALWAGVLLTLHPTLASGQTPGRLVNARSTAQDSADVVGVATALLAALSARDTAAVRAMLVPGAFLASVMDPASAQARARVQTDAQFIATLSTGSDRFLERLWAPKVFLYGTLAEVHAPYDFHLNGTFSHCGTDLFTLMRHQGAWRIVSIVYTTQRTGCPPSPLGPPAN